MKCLVIIDMQPSTFSAARPEWLIDNIAKKAQEYVDNNKPIIIVEYFNDGPTVKEIMKAVEGYDKVHFLTKKQNDGGVEIKNLIEKTSYNISNFEVCGVNLDACVLSTVLTMAVFNKDCLIKVISKCCNSYPSLKEGKSYFKDKTKGVHNVKLGR
jgi:nicotinamidase-related amidase